MHYFQLYSCILMYTAMKSNTIITFIVGAKHKFFSIKDNLKYTEIKFDFCRSVIIASI